MDLQRELLTIVDVLNAAGIPYAVCGGLAVALHGYPRATQDLDLLICEEDLPAARSRYKDLADLEGLGLPLESRNESAAD